jgi:hypothetical protein
MGCCDSSYLTYSYDVFCPVHWSERKTDRCNYEIVKKELRCKQCGDTFIIHNGITLDKAWLEHQREKDRDLDKKKLVAAEDKIRILTELATQREES